MSLDPATYSAFQDEITKIGGAGAVMRRIGGAGRSAGRTVGKWISKGWHDPLDQGKIVSTWKKGQPTENSWRWMGQGKYRRHLPIGGKSVAAGFTAAAIPSALKKEDPYGMQRSRAERSTDLGAATVGGLAGTGVAMGLPWKGWKGTRALVGGIGGAMLAARLATIPWRRRREARQAGQVKEVEKPPILSSGAIGAASLAAESWKKKRKAGPSQNPQGLRELEQW
jgi:hypothetical protein